MAQPPRDYNRPEGFPRSEPGGSSGGVVCSRIVLRRFSTSSAGLALQADVRADAGDLPVKTAAGVRLAHTHDIADVNGDGHDGFSGRDYTIGLGESVRRFTVPLAGDLRYNQSAQRVSEKDRRSDYVCATSKR